MKFWAIIIVGGVLFLLLFGKNPVREFQEQQKALMEKYGTDELSIETNVYLEQQQPSQGSFGGFMGGNSNQDKPMDMTGSIVNSNSKSSGKSSGIGSIFGGGNNQPAKSPSDFDVNNTDKIVITNTNRNNTTQDIGGFGNTSKTNHGSLANDNYYPPAVNQPVEPNASTGNGPKLRSGQSIVFEGTSVYTIDQYGNKTRLPDGKYTLQDGGQINVIGGKNVAN